MDDQHLDQLVRAARVGGRQEVGALLQVLRPLVCRWALVWTGSPDTAEDVAQRVMLKVTRSIRSFSGDGKVTAWLYKITRNALVDLNREDVQERRFRDRLELDRLGTVVIEQDRAVPEARELIEGLMQGLSARQRAVLDLVDLQGFAATEVADMLDLSPATVRVHLHRARETLRSLVQQRATEAGDQRKEVGT